MKCGYKKSFALPTVLIASVVMMIVLLAAVTATTAMRVSLASKYYNQLASSAAEAGATYAKACLDANNGVALWTDDSPLKPSTDCAGVTLTGISCPGSSACFLVNDGNVQSSFEVGAPDLSVAGKSNTIRVKGVVNLLRSSTGAVWRTYDQTETITTNYTDDGMPIGTSISGYWSSAPSGYLLEDGSAISRSTYADLFAVIGTTYGSGDGSTTFNLPDSRGRVTVNLSPNDSEFDVLGEKYGEKTHTWTVSELPSHTHGQYTGAVDDQNWSGYYCCGSGQYAPGDAGYWYTPGQTTMSTGGNGSANVIQPSIVKLSAIKYLSTTDSSSSTLSAGTSVDGYWNSKTAPEGYLVEDGSAVSRSTYADLFAAIGTTYGSGDGSTTFNLPDSRGRVGVNLSSSDTQFDTMGEKYGEKKHTMTIAEMPSHSHGLYVGDTDNGDWTGYTVSNQYPPGDAGTYANVGLTTLAAGGGVAANVIQPSIVKLSVIKYTKASASSSTVSSDISVGTSISGWWSSATAPEGYLLEDGSAVSRTTYAELFSVIGTTYGSGDGSTTFNLPDSRGRVTVNQNSSDTQFATIGAKYGEKTHTMTIAEMPSHSHGLYIGTVDDKNWSSYSIGAQPPPADNTSAYNTGQTTMSTGGGGAYNVVQPSITKLYAIKAVSNISSSHTISALVVAGGGGGGNAGGGGAGGLIYRDYMSIGSGAYSIVVGVGGVGGVASVSGSSYVMTSYATNGGNSSFASLIAVGGGGGAGTAASGLSGGSGGGAGTNTNVGDIWYGGSGTIGQGNNGGSTNGVSCSPSGGGGGAGAVGNTNTTTTGGAGGVGLAYSISGASVYYSGGGGGGSYCAASGVGGTGGGGAGSNWGTGTAGTTNTGGGGGGGKVGGAGGSGIVIISYATGTMSATGGTITTSGGRTIHTFTSSGTFTIL